MSLPLSKQQLADWILRQLGAPIVNIELADVQMEDCIDEAVQWYQQWHYEGSNRVYRTIKVDTALLRGNDRPNQPINAPKWDSETRYDSDYAPEYNPDGTYRVDLSGRRILRGRVLYTPKAGDQAVPGYDPSIQGSRVWIRKTVQYTPPQGQSTQYSVSSGNEPGMSECPTHNQFTFFSTYWNETIVIQCLPDVFQNRAAQRAVPANSDGSQDSEYLDAIIVADDLVYVNYIRVHRTAGQPVTTPAPPYSSDWELEEVAIRDNNIQLLPNGQVGVTVPKNIIGISKVFRIDSFAQAGIYNYQYQYFLNNFDWFYGQGAASGGLTGYYIQKSYIELIDFMLNTQPAIRFNQHQGKLFLDIDWDRADRNLGSGTAYFLVECYEASDPEIYKEVYQDMWLKRYATQLCKRQWGTNLKKYTNAQLPGNIAIDGQKIWDEANDEIMKMEEDLRQNLQLEMDTIIWG